jgi:MFS family permease
MEAVYGLGGLVGGALVSIIARQRRIVHVFAFGAASNAVGALLLAVSPRGPLPFLCVAALGFAGVVIQVTGTTILQAAAPRDMLGRTFASFEAVLVLGLLVGGATAGPLVKVLSPRGTTALFAVVAGLLLLVAFPGLRALESALGVRVFLRSVPLLAGLSRQLIDELAPRFAPLTMSQGEMIVREGEPGDMLYIVKDGEVEVSVRGKPVRRLATGSYFGELALLHHVPRTASVRASRPTNLYCLTRADFEDLMGRASEIRPALAKEAEANYVFIPALPQW